MRTLLPLCFGAWLLVACGAPKPSVPTNDAHANMSLMAGIKAMQKPSGGQAVVTFAIFGGPELSDEDALNSAIKAAVRRESGKALARRSRPFVVTAPNNDELPLDVKSLAASLGPAGAQLLESRFVAFVRYSGRVQPQHRQIRLALAATVAVADQDQPIIDVSTRKAYKQAELTQILGSKKWLSSQVVPNAERVGERITLFSRGMAKLGLPDLEMFSVDKDAARAAFDTFQTTLTALQERSAAKIGDTVNGVTLGKCKRAPEAIEADCVRIP